MQETAEFRRWWQTRWIMAGAVLASALPMLWPSLPPLVDLPGHLGSYRIIVEAGQQPLDRHYAVHWALIGNLGVELLVMLLHPLMDVESATHLIVGLIPPLTVAAMLWLAHEAHGRIPPAAAFAFPLAYALPFQLGFLNYVLSGTLVIAGLALWIRLARNHVTWMRIAVFLPIAGVVWTCHSFGWVLLGFFVFGAEWAIRRGRGQRLVPATLFAGLTCAPMLWPQVLAMIHGSHGAAMTGGWLDWIYKAQWLSSLLRERWHAYDVGCAIVLGLLLWAAVRSKRLAMIPVLGVPALIGGLAFVILPPFFMGGAFINARVLPYAVMMSLLAIHARNDVTETRLAIGGAAFFAMRTATTIVAFGLFIAERKVELAPLPLMPRGAGVLTLVNEPWEDVWLNPRLSHVAGIAIARRRIFTNEQWASAGQQIIGPRHPTAAPFDRDPSQLMLDAERPGGSSDLDHAIATFDRRTFGYVWTIGFPVGRARAADLVPIWQSDRSALYRVVDRSAPRPAVPVTRRSYR